VAAGKRGTARTAARPAPSEGLDLRALTPSLRSIAVGVAIVAFAAGAYAVAVGTSVFAVRTIAVTGGSPRVQAQVRRALAADLGKSLLRIDGGALERRAAALPDVISVSFDRAFPHTLKIRIKAERAVLLVRSGRYGWVVSARGRVMRKIRNPGRSPLPRLWLPSDTPITLGTTLGRYDGTLAAAAVAPIPRHGFPGGVRSVASNGSELTLILGAAPQIRLGDIGDLRLKLAIAHRIMRLAGSQASTGDYIDVSVPERPVLGPLNSQVKSTG
jgi:POTRA domain, FtsQ-type